MTNRLEFGYLENLNKEFKHTKYWCETYILNIPSALYSLVVSVIQSVSRYINRSKAKHSLV